MGACDACSMASARSPRARSRSGCGRARCRTIVARHRRSQRRAACSFQREMNVGEQPSNAEHAEHDPDSRRDAPLGEVTESDGQEHRTRDGERRIRHAEQSGAGLEGDLATGYGRGRGHRPMLTSTREATGGRHGAPRTSPRRSASRAATSSRDSRPRCSRESVGATRSASAIRSRVADLVPEHRRLTARILVAPLRNPPTPPVVSVRGVPRSESVPWRVRGGRSTSRDCLAEFVEVLDRRPVDRALATARFMAPSSAWAQKQYAAKLRSFARQRRRSSLSHDQNSAKFCASASRVEFAPLREGRVTRRRRRRAARSA